MASRYRSLSRHAFSLTKSTFTKPTAQAKASPFLLNSPSSSATLPRSIAHLGCVQSLLPLHSAVSSATPHFLSRHRFEELEIIDSGNGPWYTAISDLEDQQLKDLCQFILLGRPSVNYFKFS